MSSSKTILGDCNEVMSGFRDQEFALAHVDPPYHKGVSKMGYFSGKATSIGVKRGCYETPAWDDKLPTTSWYQQLQRISKNHIIWGANYYDFIGPVHRTPTPDTLQHWISQHPIGWIVWDKVNGNSPLKNYELAYTSFNRPTVVFPFMWNGMCQAKSLKEPYTMQGNKRLNERRIHPTQKPVALYKWALMNYAHPSDTVFDSHLGSGSHRIACHDLDFNFTGVELSPYNYQAQERRFRQHTSKLQFQF